MSTSAPETVQAPNNGTASPAPEPPTTRPSAVKITVPQRSIQGGLDVKFESDPYHVKLQNLLTPQDYTDAITKINDTMKPARATKLDAGLLAAGPLLVPLGVWAVRHSRQVKRRKRLLFRAIGDFNDTHPTLYMRWNRRPASSLTIERRIESQHGEARTTTGEAAPMSADPIPVVLLTENDVLV